MSRRILIAGNWKMNKTVSEALALVNGLKARAGEMSGVDVAVCPPYTSLVPVVSATAGTPIAVGSQNVHWEESGAFTGEVSARMLKEIPVEYAIIGHSERRQYFGETDETVCKRTHAALNAGLTPIICFGELLAQREAGETKAVVKAQVEAALAGLTPESVGRTVLAYEPVWAIGTGKTATPDQAQDVHAYVRGLLAAAFGDVAESIRILYGGSMKPKNAADLLSQVDIDGGLIGGAALNVDDFLGIITSAP